MSDQERESGLVSRSSPSRNAAMISLPVVVVVVRGRHCTLTSHHTPQLVLSPFLDPHPGRMIEKLTVGIESQVLNYKFISFSCHNFHSRWSILINFSHLDCNLNSLNILLSSQGS